MQSFRSGFLVVAGLALAAAPLQFQANATDAPVKGDLWEVSSQPVMAGMPMQMPPHSAKVCMRRDRTEPAVAESQHGHCTNTNFQRSGNRVTWEVQCTGPAMTGTGEIVYTNAGNYTGTIHFASAEMAMTINLAGKKIGECDNPR